MGDTERHFNSFPMAAVPAPPPDDLAPMDIDVVVASYGAAGGSIAAWLTSCGSLGVALWGLIVAACVGAWVCVCMIATALAVCSAICIAIFGARTNADITAPTLPAQYTAGNFLALPRQDGVLQMTTPWLFVPEHASMTTSDNAVALPWIATRTWLDTSVVVNLGTAPVIRDRYNNTAVAEFEAKVIIDWEDLNPTPVFVGMDGLWYPSQPGMQGWITGMAVEVAGSGSCTGYNENGLLREGATISPFFGGFAILVDPPTSTGRATYTCSGRFLNFYSGHSPIFSPYDGRLPG